LDNSIHWTAPTIVILSTKYLITVKNSSRL
jgi:hypothetical protein